MQSHTDPTNPRGGRGRGGRGGFDGDRGYDQRGRGRGGYEEGGRGRGGYEQRGRGRGGYEERGRGRGGYEEGGRGRGGYEERGRGRGGYEEGGRGRGGYDQRGRGRGGYEEGGRGRGGGFRGGGSFQYRSREQQAIELLPSRVGLPHDVVTNMILIHLRGATAYLYKTSYEFINGSTEPTDEWKMTAQRRALEACVGEGNKPPSNVVCTGQYLLSPVEIAELHGFSEKYKFGKTEEIRLTATFDGARALQLPADNAFLNAILGEAVMCVYATRVGGSFVDMEQCETPGNDLRLMQKITPKLMQLAGGSTTTTGQKQQQEQQKQQQHRDVLQIDVGYSVSSMESCATELHRLASRPATFRKDATLRFAGMKVVSTKPRATMLKVVEVVFDKNVDSAAGMVREPETTFSQYFARRYGLTLQDHKAPVLLCKPVGRRGKACSYPAELLYPMSLTDRQRQMLPQLCSLYPSQRHTMLQAVLKRLRESEAFVKVLRDFGVELPATSSFITCSGEVLAAPTIFIPNGNGHESCNPMLPQNLGQQGFARALSNALRHPNRCPTAVPVADFLVDPNMHGQDRSRLQQLLRKYGVNVPDMTEMVREGRYMSLALPRGKNTPLRLAIQKVDDRGCPMYADAKKEFLLAGVVSQMWKRELKDSIPNMIVQQIAAKLNHFNFVADLGQSVPTLAGQDVLLIGVHSGLSISTESTAKSVMSRRCFVVTFTAFLARGKEWSHYCNHYIRRGKHTTVWKEESGQETSTSSNTSISPKINSTDVIQEHLGKFMNAAIAHFGLHETKKKGTVIVYRGCASDGEVVECAPMVKLLPQVLPNWNYAMITAQPRSHTRFFWQASDALGLCNAPRGFITMLNHDRIYEVSSSVPVKCSFFLTAASCTLGHASNTCFVVLDMKGLTKKDIVQLTYHTCYMYPNKADSLPLPLPMKCALEYARKYQFVTGSDKLLELPPLIRPTMHYL